MELEQTTKVLLMERQTVAAVAVVEAPVEQVTRRIKSLHPVVLELLSFVI
jgi:hypothetical protein